MWREFMDVALLKIPAETFPQPQINSAGVKPILRGQYIDTSLLLQALESGENENGEVKIDIASVYGNIHSILHFVDKNNPTGPTPIYPYQDQQYTNWEYGVQKWNQETFGLLLNKEVSEEDSVED